MIRVDPEQNEVRALKQVGPWRGKKVLEIGCGDGRLTLRLARFGAGVIHAIDPSADLIRAAHEKNPLPSGVCRNIEISIQYI